jgi:hypothetical protein
MARLAVIAGLLAVVLFTGLAAGGGPSAGLEDSWTGTGWVRMETAEGGMLTVVTIVQSLTTEPGNLPVERAFRVQHLTPRTLAYVGPAVITRMKNRLVIAVTEREGWTFTVAGRSVSDSTVPPYTDYSVAGVSMLTGDTIHRNQADVISSLLNGFCGGADGSEPCEGCRRGSPGCSVDCGVGGDECSVHCAAGFSACCSCAGGCSCCADNIITVPTVGTSSSGQMTRTASASRRK